MTHQTSEFAEYSHEKTEQSLTAVQIRTVAREDAAAVAELDAQRNLLKVTEILPSIQREVDAITEGDRRRYCCVAVLKETVIGYGKVSWIDVAATARSQNLLSAWYLTGLVVSPTYRRRGVGMALTRHRLSHLARLGAQEVWYFASAVNTVSIALHDQLGFEEVTRDFAMPNVTFTGGVGILFRKKLSDWAPAGVRQVPVG